MVEITLQGRPQLAQIPFFEATVRHIAYGGARGGGKSWAMRRKFVLLALRYPRLKLLLLRRTLPELRENHILPLLGELSQFCRYSDDEKAFTFPNGSRLRLGYCDAERDVYQYQGQEYSVVGFEEATHFTESMVDFILTCNRLPRKDFMPRAYYTANPGNVGHAWFKRRFVDRQFGEVENPDDYIFFKARIYDNPALLKINPGALADLQRLPEDLRRAHLEGDWDVFAGQVFKEFRREIHVREPFSIPNWWRRFVSNDPGYNDMATWYWHAVDPLGRLVTYREKTFKQGSVDFPNPTSRVQAEEVKRLCGEERIDFVVTGHDAYRKTQEAPKMIADYYREAGLGVVIPTGMTGDKPSFNRRMSAHEYLRPYVVPKTEDTPERTEAKCCIFSTCRELIRTLPLLVYDAKDTDLIADSTDDHAYDGWSYGIQEWHVRRSEKPPELMFQPGTAGDILKHAEKMSAGGKRKGPFT